MKDMSRSVLRTILLATLVTTVACRPNPNGTPNNHLTVVVSVAPQAWLAKQLVGQESDVITLLAPGESPETYQPTDAQISRLMRATIFFRVGVPFERGTWFQAIKQNDRLQMVDARASITLRHMAHHTHHGSEEHTSAHGDGHPHAGESDPHIWLSPRLLKIQANTMAQALMKFDPSHREEYTQRLETVYTKLDKLDTQLRDKLAPYREKAFFVFHPAWGYFADEYGLRQIAVELEGKEPTDKELTEFQNLARQEHVRVIFVQPQISSRSVERIAQAIGGRVETIDPLATDIPKNLSQVAEKLVKSYSE